MQYRFLLAAFLVATTAGLTAQSTNTSFQLGYESYQGNNPYITGGIAQGDFNSDGKPDIVFAGEESSENGTYLVSQLGNGDGTFQSQRTVGTIGLLNSVPADLVAADVNHDGNLDVVTFNGQNSVEVFYGNGDGTFQSPVSFTAAHQPTSIDVGDFYDNGLLDIAVGDSAGYVEIWKNVGGKNFVPGATINVGPGTAGTISQVQVSSGNVNGTGTPDLAVMSETAGTSEAYILWGDGYGNFKPVALKSYPYPSGLSVRSLAQDGRADILISYSCNTQEGGKSDYSSCIGYDAFYGQGNDQTFYRHLITDNSDGRYGYRIRPLAVDVNGDGVADIVDSGVTDDFYAGLFVWMGHPDGSFDQTPQRYLSYTYGAGQTVAGDWNRDGKMDFAQITAGVQFYVNASNNGPCATSQINPAVTVCQPVDNTYLPSPVNVDANAYDTTPVTALQEYVDNKLVYSEEMSSFDITLPESVGPHFFVTKAWDAKGLSFRSDRNLTVYGGTPGLTCPAAPDSASICLPAGTSSGSPVHILANGYTPTAIPTAAQLYIDGNLVVNNDASGSSYVDTYQNLPSGSHLLVFKMWDGNGDTYTAQKTITVN